MNFEVFSLLLAAHWIGDFGLQTRWMVAHKRNPAVLALHCGLHALITWGLVQEWGLWQLPLAIGLMHAAIDAGKLALPKTATSFIADQILHVASLAALTLWMLHQGWIDESNFDPLFARESILLGGFLATTLGAGFLIEHMMDKMMGQNPQLQEILVGGIRGGGSQIGFLERSLIFVLILTGEPNGIGFLIAAKSILRFEEAKRQPVAEYILIGTLWSFGLAIALSGLTRFLAGI